jgi:hypothetical protein
MRHLLFLLFFITPFAFGQPVSDEAQNHYDRGQAALEMGQTQADFAAAIAEFNEAARLSPNWADVYLALGQVQEKMEKYDAAIVSYTKYIELAPTAPNAGAIKSMINKLKYKLEKAVEKEQIMTLMSKWKWNTKDSNVQFIRTGDNDHGLYYIKKFNVVNNLLQAYIYSDFTYNIQNPGVPYDQTVPIEFDGKIMRFKYDSYFCPSSSSAFMKYCPYEVKVTAEVISISPLKFKVKEEWKDVRGIQETSFKNAEWEFSEAEINTITPVKPIEEVRTLVPENNDFQYEFKITKKTYSEKDDLESAVKEELGDEYRIADWNDIVQYCTSHSVAEFLEMVDLENGDTQDPMLTYNNQHYWGGWNNKGSNRHYFISRFEDQQPIAQDKGTYLAHQNIDNNRLTLASWSNLKAHILCVKKVQNK